MNEREEVLIRILAATDALWAPLRQPDWKRPGPTNYYEARKHFAERGIPWDSGEKGEANRKAARRLLESLAEDGLVAIQGGERRLAVKLTDFGDIIARAVCSLPNVECGHSSTTETIRLARTVNQPGTVDGAKLTSELWLSGLDNYRGDDATTRELVLTTNMALPAIVRGWLQAESDCEGRVYYFATDAGQEIAKKPEPKLPSNLPHASRQDGNPAFDLYDAEWLECRQRIRTATPRMTCEIGFLPLPASINFRQQRKTTKQKAKKR